MGTLSNMETNAIRDVREIERQQLEVYRSHPMPAWAWPALGFAVFLFLSSYELSAAWVAVAAPMAYALFVGAWAGTIARQTGVQARLRGTPKPLLREMILFMVGVAALIGASVALGLLVSFVLAGVFAAVGVVLGGRAYERRYREQAETLLAGAR
jgi:hypothetical protein